MTILNEKIDVEVYGRRFTIEMEGLSQLEINSIANLVDERMRQIAKESKTADSSKLAILTALELAAEYLRFKSKIEDYQRIEDHKLESLIISAEKSVEETP